MQRNLAGLPLLFAPLIAHELGATGLAFVIVGACLLNLYCVWLVSKSERRFRNEFFMITSLHDLTYLCFGDSVIIF